MSSPLAQRIRPTSIDDMVGQEHLIGKGKALKCIIDSGVIPNMIFYGPSGTGKTTLASIIADNTKQKLFKLNGTTASTVDIKNICEQVDTLDTTNGILLYLDEIQYFNKKQQQTLLQFIESGKITLIASTTENPYFYIYNSIISRSTVFEFKAIEDTDIEKAINRAIKIIANERNEKIKCSGKVKKYISSSCGGDVRKALNALELCVLSSKIVNNQREIDLETAKEITQKSTLTYDKDGDEHYDLISAFQKSMRGSDADAAIYYLARLLIVSGLPSVCRRLMVCACEDVGLAYPQIIPIVKSCVDIALAVGLPEARIPLADAVILVCNSPKSNSAYVAINKAYKDIENGKVAPIPRQLQNKHFDGEDQSIKGQHYLYPHDYKNGWVNQNYLPNKLKDTVYYKYGDNKTEQLYKLYWDKIKNNKET